jgi:hypothetical protein
MANTLSKAGITTGNTVEAWHVTQSIDAFAGTEAYDITLSGSLGLTGSFAMQGNAVSINSFALDVTDNTGPISLNINGIFTDNSILESTTGTELNFSQAGDNSTGYFRIPIAQTINGSPRAGMMYWNDASSSLHIYSETNNTWMSASFV